MNSQLDNHKACCRCCLKLVNSRTIEISKNIEKRFEELTKLKVELFVTYFLSHKLVLTDFYSSVICVSCNSKLSEFADFQSELVENQLKLYQHVGGKYETDNDNDPTAVEEEEEPAIPFNNDDEQLKVEKVIEIEEFQVEALDEIETLKMVKSVKRKLPAKFIKPNTVDTWQCSECNDSFCSRTLLRYHVKSEHKSSSVTLKKARKMCQLCGQLFKLNSFYHHMLRAHTVDPRFVCDYCGKGFRVKHDLKDHIQTHMNRDSRRKHPCAFCPAILLSKSAIKNHEHIFHSDIVEEHPCECGKVFGSQMKLYQHRSTVHIKGHFPCPKCEKTYTVKNALQKHITKHHGAKTPCETCGKLFAPGMFMNRHMKSAHEPPQFHCNFEGCKKEFHSRSALGYHIESQHKPQETVNCPTCNAPYNSFRNLQRHIQRQHNNNVRVQCEVEGCNHTAARKDYLAAHYKSHKNIDEDTKNIFLEKVKEIKIIPW